MDSYIANEILKIEQYPDFFCWSVPSIQDDDPISILIKREIEHKGYNPDEFKWVI
jgi:hypothetical protein